MEGNDYLDVIILNKVKIFQKKWLTERPVLSNFALASQLAISLPQYRNIE